MTNSLEPPEGSGSTWDRLGALAFWATLAGFVAATIALASVNNAPGSPDSCGNLTLARNLALGRGFVSSGVGDLWVRKVIPFSETTRPPGLPYLLAAIFAVSGVSLAVPVAVNAVAVAANAWLIRGAVARSGCRWLGDVAGLLILLSYDYEMVSIWNNNILAACHSCLIWMASGRGDPGRRAPWLPIGLGVALAFGFLMKPTFILGAWPFALLLMIGSGGEATRGRRLMDLSVCLALFLALTSVYWGRNLLVYGDPMYSPSFTSSRLAMRYGVLGDDAWRRVRFDRPMTRDEVVRTLGVANMLIVDAKMLAKTVLYSTLMNPAVVACAAALILFWRPDRWRDYAGPAWLSGGIVFEVGVYNHHEFRYTWPIYPCLVYLAALAYRDFAEWGTGEMTSKMAGRFRWLFALLAASALLIGGFGSLLAWQQAFQTARKPAPAWQAAVGRLPDSAVILTSDVPALSWWSDRPCVTAPAGPREDLATVVDQYHVDHYLSLGEGGRPERGVPLRPQDLTLLDQGEGWGLYRLKAPIASASGP